MACHDGRDDPRAAAAAHHHQHLAGRIEHDGRRHRGQHPPPGRDGFDSPCTRPNCWGVPGCTAKSSIWLFRKNPAPGTHTPDPYRLLIVVVIATALPLLVDDREVGGLAAFAWHRLQRLRGRGSVVVDARPQACVRSPCWPASPSGDLHVVRIAQRCRCDRRTRAGTRWPSDAAPRRCRRARRRFQVSRMLERLHQRDAARRGRRPSRDHAMASIAAGDGARPRAAGTPAGPPT